jgi:Flp pilus assembly protein TadB
MIFALLLAEAFFITGINPFRRKSYISLSKQIQEEKFKNVDERFDKLGFKDRLVTTVQNTVVMGGSNMKIFAFMLAVSCTAGIGIGKMMFTDTGLALVTGLALIPVPYIFLKVKSRWYKRNQDELLENSLSLITNSYISCNDIIKAVSENLSKLDVHRPFAEFVTDVTLIDSNLRRGLRRLELKINNKYFSEWIDILVLSQEKSGDMRFILPAVIDGMNDAKKLQIEADTVMMNVWKEYFMSIILAFSIIPILKFSNAEWFNILINTFVGRLLIVLMLVLTIISAFITLKINKPL